jgi:ketosteroid isomerase-like protein
VIKLIITDAAALAAGYTEDSVFVGGGGGPEPHYGRQAIEKRIALDMASYPGEVSQSHELIQVYALGLDVCAIEKLTIEQWKGYAVLLFVREPDEWKIRMEYVNTLIE